MSILKFNYSEFKNTVWDNRKILIILLVLFLFATSIRSNLVRYDENYLFEPDAYYHGRVIRDLVTTGEVPQIDPLAYYHETLGGSPVDRYTFYWTVSAVLYNLLAFGSAFNPALFSFSIQFFPAIFGALISIGMYFLGREIFNSKKIGVITAFMAAVTPAFAYRTMAGAQGNNSLGFLWMVIGFVFLVRALKKRELGREEWINICLAGIFFGIMAITWTMYVLIPLILIPYFVLGILQIASQSEAKKGLKNEVILFAVKILVPLIILSSIALAFGQNWINELSGQLYQVVLIPPVLFFLAIIIGTLVLVGLGYFISNLTKENKKIVGLLVIILLYVGLLAMLIFFAVVPDLVDRTQITSLVGEESTGRQFFGTKYNALIIFPIVALFVLPLTLYLFKKRDSHTQLIFWFWTLITLVMAWYKLKFTFVFGLGVVTGAAIFMYLIFELLKKYDFGKGIEAKSIIIVSCFLLLLGVGSAAIFMPDYIPHANTQPELVEAMDWIIYNTSEDAKLFNWWSEGHMLTYITERHVSADNRNFSGPANESLALFVISEDSNAAYSMVKDVINPDYAILNENMFFSGPSFAFYKINTVNYSSPEVTKYYDGPITSFACEDNGTQVNCGGNVFSKEQFDAFNTEWTFIPTQFYNESIPMYIYRNGNRLLVLNKAMNNSNLAKVWLHSDDTKDKYEEVFSNDKIKIFKVL